MKEITLSINPTYLCNFRCDFCYLTPSQLADRNRMDLDDLEDRLLEIQNMEMNVVHVDLYGGEIGLLPEDYLSDIQLLVLDYFSPTFNIITNMSKINNFFYWDNVDVSVSYDFSARQMHEKVWNNIQKFEKEVDLLILASREVLEMNVHNMIQQINQRSNIVRVEIKPYSSNQANQHSVSHRDYEEFVKKWITSPVEKRFEFANKESLDKLREGGGHSFSDDHIYITPNGRFAVLDFDEKDNELFLEMDSIMDYLLWAQKEMLKVNENSYCSRCEYNGKCLTEHYRDVKDISQSCNGYKLLIDWYNNEYK